MRNFMPAIMLVRVVMDNDHNSLPLFGVFLCGWVVGWFRSVQLKRVMKLLIFIITFYV